MLLLYPLREVNLLQNSLSIDFLKSLAFKPTEGISIRSTVAMFIDGLFSVLAPLDIEGTKFKKKNMPAVFEEMR